MSKDKAEEKARCTLSDKELIEKGNYWISKLAKSGGEAWTLQVPVDFNNDPDMLFIELGKRLESLSTDNAQLREALREVIDTAHNMMNADHLLRRAQLTIDFKKSIDKAKQLLTDKE